MGTGTWFVMFPKTHVPTKEAVIATLSTLRSAKVVDLGDMEFTVVTAGGSFDVGLNDRSWVVLEAREVVERHRDVLDNADRLGTLCVRLR